MIIAVGADHRGASILRNICQAIESEDCQILSFDSGEGRQCDYPDQAYPVANAVADGKADLGILVCGSGIGMSIAANKVKGIRAALVHDEIGAEMSRRHNDANVLCIAADLLGRSIIERIVQVWLRTEFEGGRHARRNAKIAAMEDGRDPTTVADEQPAGGSTC